MRRREVISLLGGVAAWPLAARAQQPTMALIGLLSGTHRDDRELSAIRQGLKEAGYIEGRNVAIKYRSAGGEYDRLPALAAGGGRGPGAGFVGLGPPAGVASKTRTSTTP